jgi:hypothetical protein
MWKRHNVVALAQENFRTIAQRCGQKSGAPELVSVVAGSEGAASRTLIESYGGIYVPFRNQPLGAKFNAALRAARRTEPDAIVVLGSDNLATESLFLAWQNALEAGYDFCGILDSTQWWPKQNTFVHWRGYTNHRRGETGGSGRCYSKALLDRIDWHLWNDDISSSLDYSCTLRLNALNPPPRMRAIRMATANIRHLGIKVRTMTPMTKNVKNLNPKLIRKWFGPIGAKVLALSPRRR